MKKVKVFASLILISGFSLCVQALDFTATDGKVYKDASVLKVMPDGLVISFVDSDGTENIDHIKTNLLPDNLKAQYKLTDKAADSYDSQRQAEINAIEAKKAAEDKAYYAKQQKNLENFEKIIDYLRATEVELTFKSKNNSDFGSIGYAYRSDDFDEEAPFGLICLLGVEIEPGEEWVGKAYPLNKTTTYRQPFQSLDVAPNQPQEMVSSQQNSNVTKPVPYSEAYQSAMPPEILKIPCYADYQTALDYFSNHPQAVGK